MTIIKSSVKFVTLEFQLSDKDIAITGKSMKFHIQKNKTLTFMILQHPDRKNSLILLRNMFHLKNESMKLLAMS